MVQHDIWLTCAHIAGVDNSEADMASRKFDDNIEWKLDERVFHKVCSMWGPPMLDLFATRLNSRLPFTIILFLAT